MNWAALRTEILTDPTGRGYDDHVETGSDHVVAYLLNESQAGIQVVREPMSASDVMRYFDLDEWKALAPSGRQIAADLLLASPLSAAGRVLVGVTVGPKTQSSMESLQFRPGSRAEQVLGAGTMVGHLDVARALACPECGRPYLNGHHGESRRPVTDLDGKIVRDQDGNPMSRLHRPACSQYEAKYDGQKDVRTKARH